MQAWLAELLTAVAGTLVGSSAVAIISAEHEDRRDERAREADIERRLRDVETDIALIRQIIRERRKRRAEET